MNFTSFLEKGWVGWAHIPSSTSFFPQEITLKLRLGKYSFKLLISSRKSSVISGICETSKQI